MNALSILAADHPIWFVLAFTLVWFVVVLFVTGMASSKLRKPYGEVTAMVVRLAVAVGLLLLIGRLGWLQEAGIARLGRWQAWLLALGGLLYICCAGLYAFYDKPALDVGSLVRLPAARMIAGTSLIYVLHEELLFRGLVLTVLHRAWGHTTPGAIASVALTAALFAVPHLVSLFMGLSRSAAWLLVAQGWVIAVWWGALVVWGGSLWPAVLLHYVVNVVVPVQGLTVPMVTPDTLAYRRLLWFSIPLGMLGVGLLL